jgi:hypothetical protein
LKFVLSSPNMSSSLSFFSFVWFLLCSIVWLKLKLWGDRRGNLLNPCLKIQGAVWLSLKQMSAGFKFRFSVKLALLIQLVSSQISHDCVLLCWSLPKITPCVSPFSWFLQIALIQFLCL